MNPAVCVWAAAVKLSLVLLTAAIVWMNVKMIANVSRAAVVGEDTASYPAASAAEEVGKKIL